MTRTLLLLVTAIAVSLAGYLLYRGMVADSATVIDEADLFDREEIRKLEDYHAYLLAEHGIDYRVLTTLDGGDINLLANRVFGEREIGSHSEQGRGLLLVIDSNSRQVRLEVGVSLEAVFVDAFVGYIERDQMISFFRQQRLADGILATTELIITRAQNAEQNRAYQDELWFTGSAGGGATMDIETTAERRTSDDQVHGGSSPRQTLDAYASAMASTNLRPDLDIYTTDTRDMLANRVVTPAQADNAARSIRQCGDAETLTSADGELAVMRYPVDKRRCNPYFFRLEENRWRLDLTMMQRAIRFGRSNQWHLEPGISHPYDFAFTDWQFDSNGYPH
ncbi:MAG: TPM domain-containing protein [Sedimenticolaceae bacterium]|nr:TPM domain-containing protein [Sedimenticolaceae bacterium]